MIELTDDKLKDLSILLSQVYTRKHGREVTVELRKLSEEEFENAYGVEGEVNR